MKSIDMRVVILSEAQLRRLMQSKSSLWEKHDWDFLFFLYEYKKYSKNSCVTLSFRKYQLHACLCRGMLKMLSSLSFYMTVISVLCLLPSENKNYMLNKICSCHSSGRQQGTLTFSEHNFSLGL